MSYIGQKPADKLVTSSDMEDGIVTTAKIADDSVTNPKLFTGSQQNFRNIIINGDMSIAQRSTSVASITTSGYYTVDRMYLHNTSLGTWTQSQSTDVPSGYGFSKSFKMDCTTADASPAVGDMLRIDMPFEGQNLQYLKKGTANAQSLTASFWVKSTKIGTFICELRDSDNSRQVSKSYTVNVTNTWEFKTVTFPADTSGVLDNDNNESLALIFFLGAGTNFTSGTLNTTWGSTTNANRAVGQVNIADSTSNDFYITGVQLEAGTTASDFEFLPVDVNENRCLRYCFVVGITPTNGERNRYSNIGTYYTATQFFSGVEFPIVMRATPSFTVVGDTPAQAFTTYASNTARTSTAVAKDSSSATTIGYVITTASATQGDGGLCAWNLGYYGIIDAEL
jgi:hypothetical protein